MQKSDWKKCKLGDVAEITSSKRIFLADYVEGGVPFYRSKEIIERSAGKEISNPLFISNEKYQQIVNKFGAPQYGEMLLTSVGTLGIPYRVSQTDKFYFKDGNLTWFRKLKDISCDYLYYFFLSPIGKEKLETITIGSTQKALTIKALQNLDISLPSMEEQKRIAQILGSLDDKIELLQKQNKTLEDMAKAIFKSWFVDFDVVHAKANLEKRRRSPTETLGDDTLLTKADIMREYHLTDELYDLFPSDFENSSLGPIPLGWQVKPLSKIATFLNGLALQKYPAQAGKDFLPVIKIAELRNGISSSTDKANTNLPTEYIVHNGDILFSWSGSLMVKIWSGGKGALNQHLFKVFSNDYPKWFYYLWVNHYLPMFQEIAADKATTMGHIQRKHLDQALVVAPADLKPFTQYFNTLIDKQILNNKQIQTLTELRDTLLPRLISGKIRV